MRQEGWTVQFGWQGLIRTIVLTAVVTSAFWVLAGVWWINRLDRAGQGPAPSDVAAIAPHGAQASLAELVPMQSPVSPAAKSPAALSIPVVGVRPESLVDTFAEARASGVRRHDAIDIMAPLGTPVIAAAPGRVEKLFLSRDGGNTVYQRSPDGRTIYYYAHLERYAAGLGEGQMLRRGDPIGSVGSTGNASPSAPHLHFAVMETTPEAAWWNQARAINPYPLLAGTGAAHRATPPAR